jgi:hypothetical protein
MSKISKKLLEVLKSRLKAVILSPLTNGTRRMNFCKANLSLVIGGLTKSSFCAKQGQSLTFGTVAK